MASVNRRSVLGTLPCPTLPRSKQACLDRIGELRVQVGLPCWSVHPAQLDLAQQEAFSGARAECLDLLEFQNKDVRLQALELLGLLFSYDPLTARSAAGLPQCIEDLTPHIERGDRYVASVQRALVEVFALGIDCMVSHTSVGNFRGVAASVKEQLRKAPGLLADLNRSSGTRDQLLQLAIECVLEGSKRLESDERPTQLLDVVLNVTRLGVAVAAEDVGGAWSELVELFEKAKSARDRRKQGWYEGVILLRRLSMQMLSYPSSHSSRGARSEITPYDHFQAFLIEQSEQKRRWRLTTFSLNKPCQWQIFVAAAKELHHLATRYTHGATQDALHSRVLSGSLDDPGLLALTSLRGASLVSNSLDVERGVCQVVCSFIAKPPEGLSVKNREHFERDLLAFTAQLRDSELRKQIQSEGQHLRQIWNAQVDQVEQALNDKHREAIAAINSMPTSSRQQDKTEICQAEETRIKDSIARLHQIAEDLAFAISTQEKEVVQAARDKIPNESPASSAPSSTPVSTSALPRLRVRGASFGSTSTDDPLLPAECYDLFGQLMDDAVTTPSGHSFSERSILKWIAESGTDPHTREPLSQGDLHPNRVLREQISTVREKYHLSLERSFAHPSHGVHAQLYFAARSFAAQNGSLDGIQEALSKGAHPTQYRGPNTGNTALHYAACQEKTDLLEQMLFLLEPCDIEVTNKAGETPLLVASERSLSAVEVLLARGANKSAASARGTALHLAAVSGQIAISSRLIDAGLRVDVRDALQRTPLMYACAEGHVSVAELLLKSGADSRLKDLNFQTAHSYALQNGHNNVASLLEGWVVSYLISSASAPSLPVPGARHSPSMAECSLSSSPKSPLLHRRSPSSPQQLLTVPASSPPIPRRSNSLHGLSPHSLRRPLSSIDPPSSSSSRSPSPLRRSLPLPSERGDVVDSQVFVFGGLPISRSPALSAYSDDSDRRSVISSPRSWQEEFEPAASPTPQRSPSSFRRQCTAPEHLTSSPPASSSSSSKESVDIVEKHHRVCRGKG